METLVKHTFYKEAEWTTMLLGLQCEAHLAIFLILRNTTVAVQGIFKT